MKKLRRMFNRGPLACLFALGMAALTVGPGVYGCAGALTGPEKAALSDAEPAILAADELACDASEMIPYAGHVIATICKSEEAKVKAAIDKAVAATPLPALDGGLVTMTKLYKMTPKGRRAVAKVDSRVAPLCQFHIDTAPVDAGAEGGAR